jgi:DNA-binding MarR family transcriptional regulator
MRTKKVKSRQFHGVFILHSSVREGDECYYIRYKDKHGRSYNEKVGWKNEGYTEEEAFKVRAARIHEIRHPNELPLQKAEISESNPTKKTLPEGEQFREHMDQISRLLAGMKLDWLEPYIYTAMGLFKGFASPQVQATGKEGETGNRQKRVSLSKGEGMGLQAFKAGIELFRNEIFRELPLQQLYMILLAIENQGISLKDFRKLVGLPSGSVSRNIRKLGLTMQQDLDGKWKDTGYELVEVYRPSTGPKLKRVYLTERGKQFAEKLHQVLSGGGGYSKAKTASQHRTEERLAKPDP